MTDVDRSLSHLIKENVGLSQEIRGSSQRAEKRLTSLLPLLDLLEPKDTDLGDRLVEAIALLEQESRTTRLARKAERQQIEDLTAAVRQQSEELAKLRSLFQTPLN